jgi:type VI secretion system protein ImpA
MNAQEFLLPISVPQPAGEDMTFSAEFDAIEAMRQEDDPNLEQGEWVTDLRVADWPGVATRCEALLRERTKDLRVAVYLTEALAKTQGFAGLRDGLQVCAGLCERFWDSVHPVPEDGDMEQRSGNLSRLLAGAKEWVYLIPVTQGGPGAYTVRELKAARALQIAVERNPDDADSLSFGKVTLDAFARSQRATPRNVVADNLAAARQARAALTALQTVADARLGAEGPAFLPAKDALDDVLHELERLARDAGVLPASEAGHPAATADAAASASSAASASGSAAEHHHANPAAPAGDGVLRTRAEALQQLRQVAQFFRRTEPHSPVAYLADKAAQWGELPLHAWLRAVVKDQGALAHLEELLGVETKEGLSD